MDQLQALLRHSEERGFFSANAVARAFNWFLLNALVSDPQIVARSQRDPLLLENCILNHVFIGTTLIVDIRLLGSIPRTNHFPAAKPKSHPKELLAR